MMLYGKNGEMVLEQQGSKQVLYDKPLELLKAKLRAFRTPVIQDFPPFTGGAIGFLVMIFCNIMKSYLLIGSTIWV